MFATKHGSFGRLFSVTLAGLLLAAIAGCAGEDGSQGVAGPPGNTGGTGGTGGTGASGTLPLVDANGISSVKFMTARVSSVTVPGDGKPVIVFSLKDENNVARTGLAASASRVVMARLYPSVGGASSEWRAYTNTIALAIPNGTAPADVTWPGRDNALQATTETMNAAGSTFVDCAATPEPRAAGSVAASCPPLANSGGVYVYKMAKNITAADPNDPTAPAYNPALTHRMGMEFRVYRNASVTSCPAGDTTCSEDSIYIGATNGVYTWRPSDGATTGLLTRDIGSNTACDACHDQLNFHGGARSDVQYCVTCHNPYTTDPQSGNSVDMKVMIHKIHRGSQLYGANGYTIWGYGIPLPTKYDFKEVVFPQDQRNCQTCHRDGVTDAPDADHWKLYANKTVCGTCHDGEDPDDTTDFWADSTAKLDASNRIYSVSIDSTAAVQGGHGQVDNTQCLDCHGQAATLDGGKWIIDRAMFDPEERLAANYKFEIVKVAAIKADGTAGATACAATTKGCKVLPGEFPLVTAKISKCTVAYSSTGTCSGTETAVRLTDPEFGLNSSAAMTGRVAWTTRNFTNTQPAWPTTSGWVAATIGNGTSAVPGTWVNAPILRGQAPSIAFKPNLTITAATLANPIVFTTNASHSLQTGQSVKFAYMPGDFGTNLNGNVYTVTRVSSTTFSIAVNGTAFAAFSGYGGANYWTTVPAGLPLQAVNPAVANADGSYTKALAFPMPADAIGGSAEAFVEGRIYALSAAQPSFTPVVTRLPIKTSAGVVFNFNDASATARRGIVDINRCNDCHKNLSLHGANRNSNTEDCATCHNPENIQFAAVDPEESFDFKRMIHRLHSEGFYWDSPIEEITYPGKLNNCEGCHKANTYFPVDPAAVFATSIASGPDCDVPQGTFTVQAATRSGTTVTVTTPAAHGWDNGQRVTFAGMPGAWGTEMNGKYYSSTWVSATQFTVSVASSAPTFPAYTSGGSVTAVTDTSRIAATGAYKYPACVTSQSTPEDDTAISPNAAICSGCHDSAIAETHMEQNGGDFAATKGELGSSTNTLETCQLCHGSGQVADVKKVHRVAEYRYN